MTRPLKLFLSGCMALLLGQCAARALDPNVHPSTYPRDRWGTDQGLSQATVYDITQTPDGFLWIGTESGLVRFDGLAFTVFDKSNTPLLRKDFIQRFLVARDGSLWIATRGSGLLRLKNGRFSAITEKEGLSDDVVMELAESRDGTIWVATLRGGMCRIHRDTVERLPYGNGLPSTGITAMRLDETDQLWLAQSDGKIHFQSGSGPYMPSLAGQIMGVPNSLTPDRSGSVWCTFSATKGVASSIVAFHSGMASPRLKGVLADQESPTGLLFDRDGQGWLAFGEGGLMTFHNERSSRLGPAVLDASISCFFEDQEGSIWAGTRGGGLLRFKNSRATAIGSAQGLASSSLNVVAEDVSGRLWCLSQEWGVQQVVTSEPNGWLGGRFLSSRENGLMSMNPAREGGLWGCGTDGRLYRLPFEGPHGNGAAFEDQLLLRLTDAPPKNDIQSVFEMRDGALWLSVRDGGLRLVGTNGVVTAYTMADGLPTLSIRAMLPAADDAFWLGTQDAGVCLWKPGSARVFPGNEALERVRSILLDERGALWIGTRDHGLFRLAEGVIKPVPVAEPAKPKALNSLVEDGMGRLWIGGSGGIINAPRADFDLAAETGTPAEVMILNESDGMPGSECRGGLNPGAIRDRQGILWFATARGLARVDPARVVQDNFTPPPVIQKLFVDGIEAPLGGPLRLRAGTTRVSLEYTIPSLRHPRRVRFSTWLVGRESDWSRETDARSVHYAGLSGGSYQFRLRASNEDRVRGPIEATLDFEIAPLIYERASFQIAAGMLFAGGLWTGVVLRNRRLRARNAELEALVRQRTSVLRQEVAERKRAEAALHQLPRRILEAQEGERRRVAGELHDSVNQMLCAAKLRLHALRRLPFSDPKVRPLADEAAQVVQKTIDEVRFISRNLRPADLDDFGLVAALGSLCREVELRTSIEVVWEPPAAPLALDPDSELQIFRICQEALFNAERHSGAGLVVVSLAADDNFIVVSIRDNGKGMETQAGKPGVRSSGLGLPNMAERARALGSQLFFDGKPGKGLEIRIHIPHAKNRIPPEKQETQDTLPQAGSSPARR